MEASSTAYATMHRTQGAGLLGLTANTLGYPSNLPVAAQHRAWINRC